MEISGVRIQIKIGDFQVLRCPRCAITSERHIPHARAVFDLPDADGSLYRALAVGDAVEISLGYRNQEPALWSGTVRRIGGGSNKDQLRIIAADDALALTKTTLTQVWENETPEAIVAYAIRQTGLPVGRIDALGMVLPKVIASNTPVWQLIRQLSVTCQSAFDVDMRSWALWLGESGVNWGNFDEAGTVPVIATAAGLLTHRPPVAANEFGLVESLLVPGLLHSRQFNLIDRRRGVDARLRVQRVKHVVEPKRARTWISYGEEYGWA